MDDTIPQDTLQKQCVECLSIKSLTDFHEYSNPRKDGTIQQGHRAKCKECLRAKARQYWKRFYGITQKDYDVMFAKQSGLCAICGDPPAKGKLLYVDHCHATGIVRELLCVSCNNLLGHARENISTLKKAIDYIKKHARLPHEWTEGGRPL